MKKTAIFFAVLLIVAGLTSCATTTVKLAHYSTQQTEIKTTKLSINAEFNREDFDFIGKVTGESDYVYFDNINGTFVGDSLCYGLIPSSSDRNSEGNYLLVTDAFEIAKLNAYYNLIQNAYELGADSVLEPIMSVETAYDNAITKYKVSVVSQAIKIKID